MKRKRVTHRRLEDELQEAKKRISQLSEAILHRDMIGQAKGILMERHRITESDAFNLLVQASQQTNTRLHELADQLARTGDGPGLETAATVTSHTAH